MTTEFKSVWDALEEDPVRKENLKLRSQLLIEINNALEKKAQTQAETAKLLATTQPRVSALMKGRINEFRLDMLVDFATRLGLRVSINVAA
jgi:predicted XRE-type DNA-binding protein